MLAVLAILLIVAAIAIPRYFRFIQNARETAVMAFLGRVVTAEEAQRAASPSDAYTDNFREIDIPNVPGESTAAVEHDYRFVLSAGADSEGKNWWQITATPVNNNAAVRWFYADQTGAIRYEAGTTPDKNSPPVKQ